MSDVKPRSRAATSGGRKPPTPRVIINRELFLSACAEKGALTEEERAALLKTTPKMTYNYGYGLVEPGLTRARKIAARLGVKLDELWPESEDLRDVA